LEDRIVTTNTPTIQYLLIVKCVTCGKELYNRTATGEADFKQESAKVLLMADEHTCKSGAGPK
jgi:hypothetical protein